MIGNGPAQRLDPTKAGQSPRASTPITAHVMCQAVEPSFGWANAATPMLAVPISRSSTRAAGRSARSPAAVPKWHRPIAYMQPVITQRSVPACPASTLIDWRTGL